MLWPSQSGSKPQDCNGARKFIFNVKVNCTKYECSLRSNKAKYRSWSAAKLSDKLLTEQLMFLHFADSSIYNKEARGPSLTHYKMVYWV